MRREGGPQENPAAVARGKVTRIRAAGTLVTTPDWKERMSPWRAAVDTQSF